ERRPGATMGRGRRAPHGALKRSAASPPAGGGAAQRAAAISAVRASSQAAIVPIASASSPIRAWPALASRWTGSASSTSSTRGQAVHGRAYVQQAAGEVAGREPAVVIPPVDREHRVAALG